MRKCDHCSKAMPMGEYDRIEVSFAGKYADLAKKFYGDSRLDFCSIECLTKEMDLGLKIKPLDLAEEIRKIKEEEEERRS